MSIDKINYKPNLGYEKDYYTEGGFNRNKDDEDSLIVMPEIITKDEIDKLKDRVEEIINMLPNDIIDTYLPIVKPTGDEWENILDDIKDKEDEEDDKTEPPKPPIDPEITDPVKPVVPEIIDPETDKGGEIEDPKDPDKDSEFDDIFGEDDDNIIPLPEDIDWKEFIDKQYEVDYSDIYQDYLHSLEVIVTDYLMYMLDATAKISQIENVPSSVMELDNVNLKHLMDFAYKSDVMIKQNLMLHKKMYTTNEAIVHLRSVKIAKQYLSRYKTSEKLEVKSSLEIASNQLLEESVAVAEKKYEESFFNLYKYLNSSVILLSETLEMMKKKVSSILTIAQNETKS